MAAQSAEPRKRPVLLNERLKVKSYDGGSHRGRAQYDVRHVLTPLVDPYHSSNSGTKFNLVLESSEDFTVSHVFIAGPGSRCSEPVRSGLVFVSESLPSIEESKRYDGLSEDDLQEAVKAFATGAQSADPNLPGPCVYFKTDATSREVEVELPKWVQGRYIMVKFLDTHGRQDHMEVGVLAFIGFQGQHASEQRPIGPWMRRSVRQLKVHPNTLKSMFSSAGWVCDGRDVPGGCRSGMTDFHQTSVFTMTFRCPATGFDLCEACAFDPTLGQVTESTIRADLEALRDPSKCRLACNRLKNLMRRNWLESMPMLIEGGLLNVLADSLKCPAKADDEAAERPEPQPAEKKGSPQQALRSAIQELAQRLFGRPSGFAVGDQVMARRPGTEKWEEGKILSLPSPFANLPEPGMPGMGASGDPVPEGFGYYIYWQDGRSMVWVRPLDVFKVTAGTRNALMATVGLFTELAQGEKCDPAAVSRHLQRGADLAATDGAGYPALLLAVCCGAPVEVVKQLLDGGACHEVSGPMGMTPWEQARIQVEAPRTSPKRKELAQKFEALLQTGEVQQHKLKTLRESFGRRMLGPILTTYPAHQIPSELLDVLQLLLQKLDFQVLVDCLDASCIRALSRLLQHIVGSADGLKPALLGCRICRALVSRDEASLAQLVNCHGVHRWASWLASRKPTGPLPSPPRGHSLTSLLSGHQHQQHQHVLQQRASGEELSCEAKLLSSELNEACGEDWLPDPVLAATLATLSQPADDATLRDALQKLSGYLRMDGDIPNGLKGLDLLRNSKMCTAYTLEKLDFAGHMLAFLKQKMPQDGSIVDSDNWTSLTDVLSAAGMKQLIRTLHAVIEIGECFPIWHQKRERGLRALTDPVNLKLKQVNQRPRPEKGKVPSQFSVPVEPICPLSELRRYLLRVTPIMTEGYLSYCYGIVGATILLSSNGDPERAVVTGFELLVGELPLPIHTLQRPGKDHQRVLLAMHEHRALGLQPPEKPWQHDFQVALGRLLVAAGCSSYPNLLKSMRATGEVQDMEDGAMSPEAVELHAAALEAMKRCEANEACEVLDVELARIVAADGEKPQGTPASDNTVHPHMRAHTVSLVASDEIPFDLFWPMVRDDILGAVREACPRAHHSSESAIQAGVQQDGMGPLATRLTLEEAEMLAARVGHVVRTAVSVDQNAVQEIKKEKDKKEGEDVAVGARVQFQPRHSDTWMPGVVVGHGLHSAGKSQGRPCDIIDDHGVLWDKVPAAQVHATPHGPDRAQSSAERRPRDAPLELLSPAGRTDLNARREGLFAELMRLRDRLRFRREDEDEPEVPEEQAEQAEQEEDEEEDEDDEEESEQPPGAGAGAAAMAAFGAIGSPSDSGSASPPSFGFAGLSHAVAALSGPRSPSPPFGIGAGRPDEELRMLERFRSLEHILPEEILSGPVAGIQLRRGTGNEGVLEIRRIFEGNEGRSRGRNGAPKPPPLRAELPAFVRAADMTSPSVSLDHPVADRLGAADLEDVLPDAPATTPPESKMPPQLALRLCLLPQNEAEQAEVPLPSRDLPGSWNLMKAVHHLQGHPRHESPGFSQGIVENWSLGYSFVWTGAADFASAIRDSKNEMEVDDEGAGSALTPARKRRKTSQMSMMCRELYQEESSGADFATDNPSVSNAVQLLRLLQGSCQDLADDASLWTSSKLDKKLQVQLEDALSVVSATLPPWTTVLPRLCPFLLSLEARKKLLKYTAFGPSFAIHWVQEHKVGSLMQRRGKVQTELNSQADPRKVQELSQELSNLEEHVVRSHNWLGTLQSTLVKVSKGDLMLRQAEIAMELVSGSGHLLEVQFDGETGFGSAVTQSFYVEVSMALQDRELNRKVPLWVEDDGTSCTPYLLSRRGLLIRPLPEGPIRDAACQRFKFLGRLMGHALRDGFVAPLPLTEELFSLILGHPLSAKNLPRPGAGLAGELLGALSKFAQHLAKGQQEGKGEEWRKEQASSPDFTTRYLSTDSAGIDGKVEVVESFEQQLSLDDYLKLLGVSYLETGLSGAPLCPGGDNMPVTLENLEDFLEKVTTFWFDTGVRSQVEALRAGLNEILPVQCLASFRPSELRQMFCGEDRVEWDEKALLKHLRPSGGLSGSSQLLNHLVAVLLEMDQANRARFLDFVSSCPRLPPGGIANFHLDVFPDPKTGSRKGLPRSRACANQLYLPPYSSKEELRERLFEAMYCSVGHHEQKMRDT